MPMSLLFIDVFTGARAGQPVTHMTSAIANHNHPINSWWIKSSTALHFFSFSQIL